MDAKSLSLHVISVILDLINVCLQFGISFSRAQDEARKRFVSRSLLQVKVLLWWVKTDLSTLLKSFEETERTSFWTYDWYSDMAIPKKAWLSQVGVLLHSHVKTSFYFRLRRRFKWLKRVTKRAFIPNKERIRKFLSLTDCIKVYSVESYLLWEAIHRPYIIVHNFVGRL